MDIAVPFRVPALRRTAEAIGLRVLPWVLQIHLKNHIALNRTQESNTQSLVEEISIGVFSTSERPIISMHTVTLWNTFSRYRSDWVWLLWECNGSTGRLFWVCLCVFVCVCMIVCVCYINMISSWHIIYSFLPPFWTIAWKRIRNWIFRSVLVSGPAGNWTWEKKEKFNKYQKTA